MNLLKDVLRHEVFPALGCTEPIAVAYAAGLAGAQLPDGRLLELDIAVDPGLFKNGLAVSLPNTGGERGNLMAGVLGALIRRPELEMEILGAVTPELLARARAVLGAGRARIACDGGRVGLYVEVRLRTTAGAARVVTRGGHTHVVLIERDGRPVFQAPPDEGAGAGQEYRRRLAAAGLGELADLATAADAEDLAAIRRGIELNLAAAEAGHGLRQVAFYLDDLVAKGYLLDDVFSSSKRMTAAAADARMAGLDCPVMASGGSGNQGVVAILVPYNVGRHFGIPEETIKNLARIGEVGMAQADQTMIAIMLEKAAGGGGPDPGRPAPRELLATREGQP